MSACPKPPKKKKSAHTAVTKTTPAKTPVLNCPVAPPKPKTPLGCCGTGGVGPAGPAGPMGPAGPIGPCGKGFEWQGEWSLGTDYWIASPPTICSSDVVIHNGIPYICLLDNIADADSEPGVGANWQTYWSAFVSLAAGTGNVIWRGVWTAGVDYVEFDYVTHLGASYMCTLANTASTGNMPDQDFDYNGGANWILVSTGETPASQQAQQTLMEQLTNQVNSVVDGVMDWIKDIPNWGVTDWLKNIALGAGLLWAGSKLLDMMNPSTNGAGGGISYNGTNGYPGTYTPPTVAGVLSDLLQRVGLDPSEFDVTQVPNQPIEGGFLDNPSAQSAIDNIILTYQLNWVNVGGVMKFTPRVQSSVAVLGDGEFGYHETGSEDTGAFTSKRLQSIDLPKRVQIQYLSRDLDYGVFSQETPTLASFPAGKDVALSVPFVLTPQQARDVVDYSLIQSHLERNTWTGTTTYKWAKLEPGDVIQTSRGYGRVIQINEQSDGLLNLVFSDAGLPADPQPIYSGPVIIGYTASDYIGSGIPPTPEPIPTITGPKSGSATGVIVLDCPSLTKGDNQPRVLLAVHGYGNPDWNGGMVFKSTDGGSTYHQIASSTTSSTFGMVAVATPNPSNYHIWDTSTTIDVELKTGTLISKSEIDVLTGNNLCMIGSEVIAFKTAQLIGVSGNGNNIYRISNLIRGVAGTEWVFDNSPAHSANELFVLLDNTIKVASCELSEASTPTQYKAVSVGGDISAVTADTYQVALLNMIPWKVAQPKAIKGADDFAISWTPRSRSMGDGLEDSTEIENDPDWGGWVIAVMDGVTEKRKWQVNTPYTTYTLAQQIQDFGSEQTSVTFKIAGLNRLFSSGYQTTFTSS